MGLLTYHALKLPGMGGHQVMEWSELDTEIKTAGLKDVSSFLSPMKLLE